MNNKLEMTDILYYNKEAKKRIINGINKIANAVKVTMGPFGRTVILGKLSEDPDITKDGVTVADYIQLIDPIENIGAKLLKQVSKKTVDKVGDGTTTSIVLAQELLNNTDDVQFPIKFKNGMYKALDDIKKYLIKNKSKCKTKSDLYKVALTSANNDKTIAKNISDLVHKLGSDGIIEIEESSNEVTKYEIEEGFRYNKGYLSPYFINVQENNTSTLEGEGYALIISDKLESFNDVKNTVAYTNSQKKFLAIIAPEFSKEFIVNCYKNFQRDVKVIPILAPEFGDNAAHNLEDIAIYTEGSVGTLAELKAASPEITLGKLNKIKCGKDFTVLSNDSNISKVVLRVKQLRNLVKTTDNNFDKRKIKKRISQLSGGTATIKVGGSTKAEIKEKFDRYEDSLGATMNSMKEGILPGGGIALYNAYLEFKEKNTDNPGYQAVVQAIKKPLEQIRYNADITDKLLKDETKFNMGYEIESGDELDMIKAGIVDPCRVTISALTNAVSISSLILTTGAVIESNQINVNINE